MLTLPNIVFFLTSFSLFVILKESGVSVEDSISLFIFTIIIYLMLTPKASTEDAEEARVTLDEYKEFLGKEIVVNGFHCFIFKIKKSKNFAENSTCILYGKHTMTGEKRAFGVNVNEKSVKEFMEDNKLK